jgi:hypothetical protein
MENRFSFIPLYFKVTSVDELENEGKSPQIDIEKISYSNFLIKTLFVSYPLFQNLARICEGFFRGFSMENLNTLGIPHTIIRQRSRLRNVIQNEPSLKHHKKRRELFPKSSTVLRKTF